MTRRAYLYFVITFIVGIILGGAGTYYYAWGTGHWRRNWSRQKAESRIVHRLTHDLDLSPQQTGQLRPIIDNSMTKWSNLQEQLRQQAKPQFEALHAETDSQIKGILSASQAKKFEELHQEHKKASKPH